MGRIPDDQSLGPGALVGKTEGQKQKMLTTTTCIHENGALM
jgi:hypothetical protein